MSVNTRTRQKIRAELGRKNPDVMATLPVEGLGLKQILFVPRSEMRAYRARYGDRIEFWEEEAETGAEGDTVRQVRQVDDGGRGANEDLAEAVQMEQV